MKNLQTLMQEIIVITATIETDYPELYTFLNETPIEICSNTSDKICILDLKNHLESLKEILNHYMETHPKK